MFIYNTHSLVYRFNDPLASMTTISNKQKLEQLTFSYWYQREKINMASVPTQTYVMVLNSSDMERMAIREYNRPLYIHTYTDLFLFSFLIIVSFTANAVLATTLATNRYLQQISSYVPILGLTLTQLFDALFNGLVSLAYMCRVVWDMGYALCAIHTYSTHLALGLSPLLLATTAVDRYFCLNYPEIYRVHLTCGKHRLILVTLLLLSAAFSVPYLTPVMISRPFPARISCAGSISPEVPYIACWTAFIIALPLLLAISLIAALGHTLWLDRREKRRVQSRAWLEAKGIPLASGYRPPLAHHEVRSIWVWITLCLIYLLSTLPFVIHSVMHQLGSWVTMEDVEHNNVCVTPYTDVTTAWLRYLATALNPVAIFAICDDVRQETLMMVSSWRGQPSSVIEEVTSTVDDIVEASSKSSWWKKLKGSKVGPASASLLLQSSSVTPVLFPTNFGLQMRYLETARGPYVYAWVDQVDSCCLVKPQPRDDSGYRSLHRRHSQVTPPPPPPPPTTRKRHSEDAPGQFHKKKRDFNQHRSDERLPNPVRQRTNSNSIGKSKQQQVVNSFNAKATKLEARRRSRASSLDHVRRTPQAQPNKITKRTRQSRSLERFPVEKKKHLPKYQRYSNKRFSQQH